MYILTDYSKKELSLTIAAYDYQIHDKKQLIAAYNSYGEGLDYRSSDFQIRLYKYFDLGNLNKKVQQ